MPVKPVKKREGLWTKDFIAGTLSNLMMSVNYFMLMVIMTAYALEVYDAPAAAAAFCASIFVIGTLIARFTTAPLLNHMSSKLLLLIANICVIAFSALYLVGVSIEITMIVRAFHGLAYGFCTTTLATSVTTIIPRSKKGEGIGYYTLSVTCGAAIGPFAGIFISNNLGYTTLFICAVIVAAVAFPCIAVMKVPSFVGMHKKEPDGNLTKSEAAVEEAEEVISAELSMAPKEREEEEAYAESLEDKPQPSAPRGGWVSRFLELSVIPLSLVCGLVYFAYSSLLTFLTPYSIEIGLARAASVFFIVYAISMFITRPFIGRAFDRRGPNVVMIPSFISVVLGMILVAISFNDWILLGSALLLGFGIGNIQSCGLAMAVRMTPDTRLNLANASFYIMIDLGVGVGPVILGIFTPILGYSITYMCMGGITIVALILFLIVTRNYHKRIIS
ncbi:MAG: MFS transporter [Eggerthellaceae bacterium]|nr:MFS transporter [Eggerthellaceae bacterium]